MRQFKLFVSYCRDDLSPPPGFNESRMKRILDDIEYQLAAHNDRSPFRVLRDEDIVGPSETIHANILRVMAECDMAIIFLSSNYCLSEECEVELPELSRSEKPLFLVVTEPIWFGGSNNPLERYLDALRDILHVKFWESEMRSEKFWESKGPTTVLFGDPMPDVDPKTRPKYYDAIRRLTSAVKKRAREQLEAEGQVDDLNQYTVFMACATPEVAPDAKRLARSLRQAGHSILEFDPAFDISSAASFKDEMSKLLARCTVYVQVLGSAAGKQPPEAEFPLTRAQYETAKQAGFPMYVWRSPAFKVDPRDMDYQAFLKDIALNCHFVSYPEFENYLRRKLDDLGERQRSDERRAERAKMTDINSSLPLVAIDSVLDDRDLADKISAALERYVNVSTLEYDLNQQSLSEAVSDNNALVLAYGKSSEGRKRACAHLGLVRRLRTENASRKLELAVGNGAPSTVARCPRGPDVYVINVPDEVDSTDMFGFLQRLGVAVPQGGAV